MLRQAENAMGPSPWSAVCRSGTSATVPGQPTPPCVVSATPTAVLVQWIAPFDGGAELTEYMLESDDGWVASCVFPALRSNIPHVFQALPACRAMRDIFRHAPAPRRQCIHARKLLQAWRRAACGVSGHADRS